MKSILQNIFKRVAILLACLSILPAISSCVEEDMPYIVLDQEEIEVGTEAEKYTIDVKSNLSWTANCDESWVELFNPQGQYKGDFAVAVSPNTTTEERTAVVTVSSTDGSIQATVILRQVPMVAEMFLTEEQVIFAKMADSRKIRVVSNHKWNVVSSADWCTVSPEESSSSSDFEIKVEENLTGMERKATVSVICEINVEQPIIRTVEVIQKAEEFFFMIPTKVFHVNSETKDMVIHYETSDKDVVVRTTSDVDWISLDLQPSVKSAKDITRKNFNAKIQANLTGIERTGKITVIALSKDQKPVTEVVEVIQTPDSFFFVVPNKEYQVGNEETTIGVTWETGGKNVVVKYESTVDWITLKRDINNEPMVHATVAHNEDGENRKGQIILYASNNGGEPTVQMVDIYQSTLTSEVSFNVAEVNIDPEGETLEIPFAANVEPTIGSSSPWCPAVLTSFANGAGTIQVIAEANYNDFPREAYLTATAKNESGNPVTTSIKLIQQNTEFRFRLSESDIMMDFMTGKKYITLEAMGKWSINSESVPKWIKIDKLNGEGDAVICIEARENILKRERSTSIVLKSEMNEQYIMLTVTQAENPNGIVDFKHLGKGFDASGIYAHDAFVKSSVLDCDKLYEKNKISDIISTFQTDEAIIKGNDFHEYQNEYSIQGGVETNIGCFSGSISANFSSKSTSSSENSFATYRHMTKKQIIKINENENAKSLTECISDNFKQDVENLNADALISKYGTHVIAGFSLGGVLEYSMSTLRTAMNAETNMDIAVTAGFEFTTWEVTGTAAYNEYNKISKSTENFEEKLLCRGGSSQFASMVNKMESYEGWLTSLEEPEKWVMVDYEGKRMIPLWEFVEDKKKSQDLELAIRNYLENNKQNEPAYKTFEFSVNRYWANDTDGPGEAGEFTFNLYVKLDDMQRNLWSQGSEMNVYPGYHNVGRRAVTFLRINRFEPHTVSFITADVVEHDNIGDDGFSRPSITLDWDPDKQVWKYRNSESVMELHDECDLTCLADGATRKLTFYFRWDK